MTCRGLGPGGAYPRSRMPGTSPTVANGRRCSETGDGTTDGRGAMDGPGTGRERTRGHARGARSSREDLQRTVQLGSWPAGVSAGNGTTTFGVMPVPWIQVWLGVSHFAMDSRNPPESPDS